LRDPAWDYVRIHITSDVVNKARPINRKSCYDQQ
jgi:hypothetical protein